jgi:hypothetical protein
MKPRIRPISNLYFQFIKETDLEGKISAQRLADYMMRDGLIELIPHNSAPRFEHYREVDHILKTCGPAFEGTYLRSVIDGYMEAENEQS